jgi:hypothetical protein
VDEAAFCIPGVCVKPLHSLFQFDRRIIMPVNQWKPKKRKVKFRYGAVVAVLLILIIPVVTYILFPDGNETVGVCVMLLYSFLAAIALAIDEGIWLWLFVVFEAALWPVITISAPKIGGDFSTENLLWLGGKLLFTVCFCLVGSGIFGLPLRHIIRALNNIDDD